MHDRLLCVRLRLSLYFRNKNREQSVAKTNLNLCGKSIPQSKHVNCLKQKGKCQAQICSYSLIAQFTLEVKNEITKKKEKRKHLKRQKTRKANTERKILVVKAIVCTEFHFELAPHFCLIRQRACLNQMKILASFVFMLCTGMKAL